MSSDMEPNFKHAGNTQSKADQYKQERRQVWSNAWASTANANDCKSTDTATKYADKCLEAFDLRFRADFL